MLSDDAIRAIADEVVRKIAPEAEGGATFPIGVSGRHMHICQQDLERLFGPGAELTPFKELRQPGQYAAKECVLVAGPKGALERVRILGPVRPKTQIEVSLTDTFTLGVRAPVRHSGHLDGSGALALVGPKGTVALAAGLIVAARHVHVDPARAAELGIEDKQIVRMVCRGEREVVFGNVLVRCGDGHLSEFHLDTDEANSAGVKTGDLAEILI